MKISAVEKYDCFVVMMNNMLVATYVQYVDDFNAVVEEIRQEVLKSPKDFKKHILPDYHKLICIRVDERIKSHHTISDDIVACREGLVNLAHYRYYPYSLSDAEDLVQEGLIKAMKNQKYYDADKGKLYAWVASVMYRVFLDKKRKEKRFYKVDNEVEDFEHLMGVEDETAEPEVDIDDVRNEFHILTPREKTFMDYRLRGYKNPEIAKMYGITEGTVKIAIHRAKNKLIEHFGKAA